MIGDQEMDRCFADRAMTPEANLSDAWSRGFGWAGNSSKSLQILSRKGICYRVISIADWLSSKALESSAADPVKSDKRYDRQRPSIFAATRFVIQGSVLPKMVGVAVLSGLVQLIDQYVLTLPHIAVRLLRHSLRKYAQDTWPFIRRA